MISQIDFIFPFVVFFYGFLMLFVIQAVLTKTNTIPEWAAHLASRVKGQEPLAWTCLFVGGIWSLQNLWI